MSATVALRALRALIGLTGTIGSVDHGQGTTLDDLAPPPGVVTVYGAEWCAPCNDLVGFVADIEAAKAAVGGRHI